MVTSLVDKVRAAADKPASPRLLEALVMFALACWTFGQIVFVHSTVGIAGRVAALNPSQYYQSIVFGCLIAVIASRGFDLDLPKGVLLGLTLFAALSVRSRVGDSHLIVLALFAVAAYGMDFQRLAKVFVISSVCALVCVVGLASISRIAVRTFMVGGHMVCAYGFANPQTLFCLIFSILTALALSLQDGRAWIPLALVSACGAVLSFVALGIRYGAILLLAFGACLVWWRKNQAEAEELVQRNELRWVVALLPVALCCLTFDAISFYSFESILGTGSAYVYGVRTCGLLATACFGLWHVYLVRTLRLDDAFVASLVLVLFSLMFAVETSPTFLEFNVALLLLACQRDTTDAPAKGDSPQWLDSV